MNICVLFVLVQTVSYVLKGMTIYQVLVFGTKMGCMCASRVVGLTGRMCLTNLNGTAVRVRALT